MNQIEKVKAQTGSASEIFLRLADFKQTKRLQVELLLLFVKLLDQNDLKDNEEAF